MHYNEELADKQGISRRGRELLDITYDLLIAALENPENFEDPGVEEVVRNLEYRLQELWKFPQDPKFHRYQTHIKGCTCPKLDNAELVGYDADRYRTSDCPWHWNAELEAKMQDVYEQRRKRFNGGE